MQIDNAWIREGLKGAGKTKSGLAQAMSVPNSAVTSLVQNKRSVRVHELPRIIEYLGIRPPSSAIPVGVRSVPLLGYVGAGAQAHYYAEGDGLSGEEVDAPDGATESTVAVEVRGESLGALFDRWLVFYDDVRDPPSSAMLGRLCVVGLADGRILVKKLQRGQLPGHFNLISNTEPPMYDQLVQWAAVVKQMTPR